MRLFYNRCLKKGLINSLECSYLIQKLYLDEECLTNLLWTINSSNAKVVVISSWATEKIYPLIQEHLLKMGIPIIDSVINNNREDFIEKYIFINDVTNFVILDDDYFKKYKLYPNHFIHCNFYNKGFDYDMATEAIYKLMQK